MALTAAATCPGGTLLAPLESSDSGPQKQGGIYRFAAERSPPKGFPSTAGRLGFLAEPNSPSGRVPLASAPDLSLPPGASEDAPSVRCAGASPRGEPALRGNLWLPRKTNHAFRGKSGKGRRSASTRRSAFPEGELDRRQRFRFPREPSPSWRSNSFEKQKKPRKISGATYENSQLQRFRVTVIIGCLEAKFQVRKRT